ncbi:MAG: hypothetical protein LM573_01145 [Thermofilum sp.]|nr:hypothetical protein [Thermofilum sp.]
MICGLVLVGLEKWSNEEAERSKEVVISMFKKVVGGEKISLLDFAPEYKSILRDKTYGLWRPPGDIKTMLQKPIANLASMLDKRMPVPSILLVLINIHRNKPEFMTAYGLVPEKGGLSYENFLQEIREGRILPILTGDIILYKADFYQDIVKVCEEGEIQQPPPFLLSRVLAFMKVLSLYASAIQEGIPLEEGWEALVLQKHPEYDIEFWMGKAKSMLNEEKIRILAKKYSIIIPDKEYVFSYLVSDAFSLSVFGFFNLVNLSLKTFGKNPWLGFGALLAYHDYLVSGYANGLGGLRMYDRNDLELMTFLRILKKRDLLSRFLGATNKKEKGALPLEEETIMASPAGFSVVGSAVELPMVARFDVDDLRSSLKRERDKELERNMLEAMRAFQSYDFAKFREKNETINEIIAERIAKETRSYYRRSKIVEGTFVAGGTLTLAAGAIAVYQYLQPLLSLYSVFAGKAFDFMIKKREDVAKWLVSSWPFQQKGLPFYLWLHNTKPDKIQKALNA